MGYYRQFISHFASLAAPLSTLFKKDIEYLRTRECQSASKALKSALQKDPVLNIPSDEEEATYVFYTDWLIDAISTILHQRIGDVEHVIEFASKSCNKHKKRYCPTKRELITIIYGLAKYRSYLLGQEF